MFNSPFESDSGFPQQMRYVCRSLSLKLPNISLIFLGTSDFFFVLHVYRFWWSRAPYDHLNVVLKDYGFVVAKCSMCVVDEVGSARAFCCADSMYVVY